MRSFLHFPLDKSAGMWYNKAGDRKFHCPGKDVCECVMWYAHRMRAKSANATAKYASFLKSGLSHVCYSMEKGGMDDETVDCGG